MKLAYFEELCRRQWEENGADVVALHMPGGHLAELAGDVAASLSPEDWSSLTFLDAAGNKVPGPPAGACGVGLSRSPNPATGSGVALTCDPDADSLTVTVREPDGTGGLAERTFTLA